MVGDLTGALRVTHAGAEYNLRLTMRGFAALQAEFGKDVGGLLTGKVDGVPDFAILLRVVELALLRGMPGVDSARLRDLADDLLSADPRLWERIVTAAFPSALGGEAGNAAGPKAAA